MSIYRKNNDIIQATFHSEEFINNGYIKMTSEEFNQFLLLEKEEEIQNEDCFKENKAKV